MELDKKKNVLVRGYWTTNIAMERYAVISQIELGNYVGQMNFTFNTQEDMKKFVADEYVDKPRAVSQEDVLAEVKQALNNTEEPIKRTRRTRAQMEAARLMESFHLEKEVKEEPKIKKTRQRRAK